MGAGIDDSSSNVSVHKTRTSDRTTLGLVLQELVEVALNLQGISFEANARYFESFIRPDVLIPGCPPKLSIHVTATGGDDNFRKKKWRYIDEVLQMRSVWKSDFVTVNLLFGPLVSYQSGDLALMRTLFDREIVVDEIEGGSDLYRSCLDEVERASAATSCKQLVSSLIERKSISTALANLGRTLRRVVSETGITKHSKDEIDWLSGDLNRREGTFSSSSITRSSEAYWKRTILRFLTISPKHWDAIIGIGAGDIAASELPEYLLVESRRGRLLSVTSGVIDKISLPSDVGITLRAGLTKDFITTVASAAHANPRRRYELDDLWDGGHRARVAVTEVANAVANGNSELFGLIVSGLTFGGSPLVAHHRAHVIDVLVAAVGLSLSQVQERYKGPGIGVVDPIRNLVPRTDIAVQAITSGKLNVDECVEAILKVMRPSIAEVNWEEIDRISEAYLVRRVSAIANGSSIDPLEEFVRSQVESQGWLSQKSSVQHRSTFIGKTKLDFDVIAAKNEKLLVVKCLFGDTGADHKAEEMEARIRLLRLSPPAKKELVTVFIADGKWSSNNLKSLYLGGWDHVVSVAEFQPLLATL